MQFILSEEELDDLKERKRLHEVAQKEELQKLCTLACNHIPVIVPWDKEADPKPWGCILSQKQYSDHYCDECPVDELCPYNGKNWSK